MGLGRLQEARALLDQALVKRPEHPSAILALAILAAYEKRTDEASNLIERALKAAPKEPEGWLLKGDLAKARGDCLPA